MPELPEVETSVQAIQEFVKQKLESIEIYNPNLRWKVKTSDFKKLHGHKVENISRRAKYIILDIEMSQVLIHLGMTGTLRIANKKDLKQKHDHFEIYLSSNLILRFNDPRKFGMIFFSKESPITSNRLLSELGVEPLEKNFNEEYLYSISRSRNIAVKSLLMNAKIVVGIGNIYASEALFLSKIKPQKVSKKLTKEDCKVLVTSIKKVLKKAIKKGGSSINDYINVDGKKGYFQYDFKVYGRTNMPCHICQNDILQIKINQRSSFYCKNCQK